MKSSEALMIGSVLMRARAGTVYTQELGNGGLYGPYVDAGCALGMIAAGYGHIEKLRDYGLKLNDVLPPWICDGSKLYPLPCLCGQILRLGPQVASNVIIHVFDSHVAGGDYSWSVERLADWLRYWEPKELLPAIKIAPSEPETVDVELVAVG